MGRFVFAIIHAVKDPTLTFDYNGIAIDSQMISDICTILESDEYDSQHVIDFAGPIDDIETNHSNDFWIVLKHLLTFELGYIRYDDDIEGYKNALRKGKPRSHPQFHIDVNSSNQATYKMGLSNPFSIEDFIYILDNDNDERLFLRKQG